MGDDEGGFFDGFDDGGNDDGGSDDSDNDNSYNDDSSDEDSDDDSGYDDPGNNNNDDDSGDNDDGSDSDDHTLSADDFPNASEEDFTDDDGSWSADDYAQSAENLFGDHEYFGDTIFSQLADQGYAPFQEPAFLDGFEQVAPGSTETLHLFERDGQLSAFGFLQPALLAYLMGRYTGIDFSNVDVAPGDLGGRAEPQPLPPQYASLQEADAVDLRKYATPVGDQGQTSRCSAFAWTHAAELINVRDKGTTDRLSPSFTMLNFQRMQGDDRDYEYAASGGNGTIGGPDPGRVLVEQGTCRQELWPDNAEEPRANERVLQQDAVSHRLEGAPQPIALDDVRKVLTAGCPVHVAMNTGPAFSQVGRDGVFNAAEPPSGRHGRHAMLLTGYTGNFFSVKNSWGEEWGDKGYGYIPKNVLAQSDPEFIAILKPQTT